jgi:hypothetical protein
MDEKPRAKQEVGDGLEETIPEERLELHRIHVVVHQ